MSEITIRQSIQKGLAEALDADPNVFIMGEDIGDYGGAYAITSGFLEKYGPAYLDTRAFLEKYGPAFLHTPVGTLFLEKNGPAYLSTPVFSRAI